MTMNVKKWVRDRQDGDHRWLFVDDHHIAQMHGLRRSIHSPELVSSEPVLRPEMPWESTIGAGTVLFDEQQQRFRLWYYTCPGSAAGGKTVKIDGQSWPANRSLVCYAESDDGIVWHRPMLGQVEFEGSKENNIVRIGQVNVEGIAVYDDFDETDPNRRFKAFYWDHGSGGVVRRDDGLVLWNDDKSDHDGICVSFSPDGVQWSACSENPVIPFHSDTFHHVVRDPRTGRYIAYGRFGFFRTIARVESDDFINWSTPQVVLEPDAMELAGAYPATQFYAMAVDIHEGMYVGGLWVYREGTDGRIDTQLTVSRDGVTWTRVADRQTFVPCGRQGPWDEGMARAMGRFIRRNEDIYILYSVVNGPHAGPRFPGKSIVRQTPPALSMGKLRRDGVISLDADGQGGWLLTHPMVFDGRPLYLNADIDTGGEIIVTVEAVESLDPEFSVQSGRDAVLRRSIPMMVGGTKIEVDWPQADALETMAGYVGRLRLYLRSARVFSMWF